MKIIQIKPHKDDCFAVEAVTDHKWRHPWGLCRTEWIAYDKLGGRHPRTQLYALVFTCNDPSCPGKVAVSFEDALKALGLVEETKDEEISRQM